MQTLPKLGYPLGPSIKYYANMCPVESKDVAHIQICQLLGAVDDLDCNEVSYLGQSISNHPDRIMAFRGSWQTHNKVHGYTLPLPHGHV
jgi:hypothetical protein